MPPSTERSKKCSLCGKNGYMNKVQSLLYDWHGKLIGEADWEELSAKYAKKEGLNLMNGKIWTKEKE